MHLGITDRGKIDAVAGGTGLRTLVFAFGWFPVHFVHHHSYNEYCTDLRLLERSLPCKLVGSCEPHRTFSNRLLRF